MKGRQISSHATAAQFRVVSRWIWAQLKAGVNKKWPSQMCGERGKKRKGEGLKSRFAEQCHVTEMSHVSTILLSTVSHVSAFSGPRW